jgi:4-hydroxybenzoate polyprenyltransferase
MKNAWLRLMRFEHSLMVLVAIVASEFIVSKRLSLDLLYPAVGPALITLAAFAWNDYFGLKSDKELRRKERPLVSGEIKPAYALIFSLAFFALGVTLTFPFGQAAFAIAFAYALLSMAYDPILKKLPLAGNVFIASSMSISFVYGNLAVSPALNSFALLFAGIAFFAGLGRELLITLRDVEGDKKLKATTLPMLLGPKMTVLLANASIFVAIALSMVPLFYSLSLPYFVLIIVSDSLFFLATSIVSLKQDYAALSKARDYTLYALMTGIIAFATLGF